MYGTESAGGGGVLGWVSRRLTAQLGSTVSAVGLVWWVTSMLSTAVHRMVRLVIFSDINRYLYISIINYNFNIHIQILNDLVSKQGQGIRRYYEYASCTL